MSPEDGEDVKEEESPIPVKTPSPKPTPIQELNTKDMSDVQVHIKELLQKKELFAEMDVNHDGNLCFYCGTLFKNGNFWRFQTLHFSLFLS